MVTSSQITTILFVQILENLPTMSSKELMAIFESSQREIEKFFSSKESAPYHSLISTIQVTTITFLSLILTNCLFVFDVENYSDF
jgi:hypothetical protein